MGTVVGSWRLKLILLIVILMSLIYTVNGFFYDVPVNDLGYMEDDTKTTSWNDTAKATNQSASFIDVLGGFGDFVTFGNIDNIYARIILSLFTTICLITIGYIIFTFVKEFVPFV